MADTAPHRSPLGQAAHAQGVVLTQMLIVADVERSVGFYRDVLGATVVRDEAPAMLRFYNGWIVINTGGGPTPDKPDVTAIGDARLDLIAHPPRGPFGHRGATAIVTGGSRGIGPYIAEAPRRPRARTALS